MSYTELERLAKEASQRRSSGRGARNVKPNPYEHINYRADISDSLVKCTCMGCDKNIRYIIYLEFEDGTEEGPMGAKCAVRRARNLTETQLREQAFLVGRLKRTGRVKLMVSDPRPRLRCHVVLDGTRWHIRRNAKVLQEGCGADETIAANDAISAGQAYHPPPSRPMKEEQAAF